MQRRVTMSAEKVIMSAEKGESAEKGDHECKAMSAEKGDHECREG